MPRLKKLSRRRRLAVVGGAPDTGCVSQPGDYNGQVPYAVCCAASFRPWQRRTCNASLRMGGRCTGADNGVNMFRHRVLFVTVTPNVFKVYARDEWPERRHRGSTKIIAVLLPRLSWRLLTAIYSPLLDIGELRAARTIESTLLAGMTSRHSLLVITARCTIVQSAVLRSHVVRPSVCPSVCDVGDSGPHRLEILETNCTDN